MAPRVSVLMPTHNRADVIGFAIESVLRQTEPDFELLVVADGCTDDTARVVRSVDDRRIRLFNLPKAPFFGYANRNIALREARGEFVAFAAHDDLLFPDHLAMLIAALESSGCEWGYSRPLWVSTDGVVVPSGTNLTLPDELEFFLTQANTIPASCVVYRRSCLDRYGYWPEDVPSGADWAHWTKIVEGSGRALSYVEAPTTLHFSANWRASRHADRPEVLTALQLADDCAWWPAVLRFGVPEGIPEQRVMAEAMIAGGEVWAQSIRDAVRTTMDRLACDDMRDVRPRLMVEEAARRAEQARADRAEAACVTLMADVARRDADSARIRATTASLSRSLNETRRPCDQSNQALREARSRLQAADAHLAAIQISTSWRVTQPLRLLKEAWRRLQTAPVE